LSPQGKVKQSFPVTSPIVSLRCAWKDTDHRAEREAGPTAKYLKAESRVRLVDEQEILASLISLIDEIIEYGQKVPG
jgi:hypothetical protein